MPALLIDLSSMVPQSVLLVMIVYRYFVVVYPRRYYDEVRLPSVYVDARLICRSSTSTPDLWKLAVQQLKRAYQEELKSIGEPRDLLEVVRQESQTYKEKQLKIKRSGGKEPIVVHDALKKAAFWIEKFVKVGDTAIQYDPEHAALPWAAIRAILIVRLCALASRLADRNTGYHLPCQ